MFKKIRNKPLTILAIVLWGAFFVIAAKPAGITHLTSLWIGDATDTADVTPGANDLFVSGTAEIDGAVRIDGALDLNSTMIISGVLTATGNTSVINLPLAGPLKSNTTGSINLATTVVSASSKPGLEIDDSHVKLVWADGETTMRQIMFVVPDGYAEGGSFEIYCTRSSNGAPPAIDYSVLVNRATGNVSNEVSVNQTAVALSKWQISSPQQVNLPVPGDFATLAAADIVTFFYWRSNVENTSTDDLEVMNVLFTYTGL